ncbi:MAG: hypothetical protein CMJ23_10570 [Phycisphaerae bacterium]|nr:hypothetical protein [Phycisphaerae bacterium]
MRHTTTIAIALVSGIAAALVVTSLKNQSERNDVILEALRSPEVELRREAWALIPASDGLDPETITPLLLDSMNPSPPAALADAAREFLDRGWPIRPELVDAAAVQGDSAPLLAWLESNWPSKPGELEAMTPGLRTILTSDQSTADDCVDLLFSVDSPAHRAALRSLMETSQPASDPLTSDSPLGRSLLAMSLLEPEAVAAPTAEPLLRAAVAFLTDSTRTPAIELERLPAWMRVNSAERRQLDLLQEMAEGGDADAELAIAMQDQARVINAERRVLADPEATFNRRSLAGSRLLDRNDEPGDATVLGLLADGPADPDGTVHAAAILAWRGLSETAVRRIEERWLDSDEPEDVRAAMLLGVLRRLPEPELESPADPTLLAIDRHARSDTSPPRVRRTARLAARALDLWPFDPTVLDPDAYAARATRLPDGRVDPDAVLLGLLADDPLAERRLVSPPVSVSGEASILAREIGWRVAIANLLRADWMTEIGEPIPGDEADLRLWVDVLAARRLAETGFARMAPSGEDHTR